MSNQDLDTILSLPWIEVLRATTTQEDAYRLLCKHRWPDGKVTCPDCGNNIYIKEYSYPYREGGQPFFLCRSSSIRRSGRGCGKQFTARTGNFFQHVRQLPCWIRAVWLWVNKPEVRKNYGALEKRAGLTPGRLLPNVRRAMDLIATGHSEWRRRINVKEIGRKCRKEGVKRIIKCLRWEAKKLVAEAVKRRIIELAPKGIFLLRFFRKKFKNPYWIVAESILRSLATEKRYTGEYNRIDDLVCDPMQALRITYGDLEEDALFWNLPWNLGLKSFSDILHPVVV